MSKRGFASMDPAKQKEIASLGGKKAHAVGRAHRFTTAEATEAGKKGGATTQMRKREQGGKAGRIVVVEPAEQEVSTTPHLTSATEAPSQAISGDGLV